MSYKIGCAQAAVSQVLLCPMSDVEHMHSLPAHSAQEALDVPPPAVEQLPDFFAEMPVLRSQRAAFRELCTRVNRLDNPCKPAGSRLGGPFASVGIDRVSLGCRIGLDGDVIGHASSGMWCFLLRS